MTKEERKDAIAKLNTVAHYGLDLEQSDLVDDVIEILEREQVSVTPTREHGEWIKMPLTEVGQTYSHKCSLCGRRILATNKGLSEFPYCHCGADMRKEQK